MGDVPRPNAHPAHGGRGTGEGGEKWDEAMGWCGRAQVELRDFVLDVDVQRLRADHLHGRTACASSSARGLVTAGMLEM